MSESKDIATRSENLNAVSTSAVSSVAEMLNTMMALAKDPTVDAAKFETIARVANEQQDRFQRQEYYAAKARAIRAMPVIRKDGRIVIQDKNDPNNRAKDRVQGHFERWPDVQRAITPPLVENGLTLTHDVDTENGKVIVIPILQHDNGYIERGGRMELPLDTSGGKNNVQGAGSAQSYGLRYSTRAMLGLKFEPGHDDGNLIALPDEPLNDQQQRRVAEAEALWAADPQQFEDWWSKLQPQDKAWMIQTGRYAAITGKEAGRLVPHTRDDPPPAKKPEDSTPVGWVEQYEKKCKECKTLDELASVQRKGANGLAKLKADPNLKALHDRAIKAGGDAYERLTGQAPSGDDLFEGGQD